MAKMKAKDFCEKALEVENLPTLYKLGKFMNSKSGRFLLCDCSGLIKGILWGYPSGGKYKSNGVSDWNADTIISKCSNVTTDFSKLEPGWAVWMPGHIGIYTGDGVVVEASPIWENGIQKTYPTGCPVSNKHGLHSRKWTKCGKMDMWIDYTTSKPESPKEPSKPSSGGSSTYKGNSLVDYLNSIGKDNSYSARKKLAQEYGISNYTGTAAQNTKLLNMLRNGASAPSKQYYKKYTGKSGSISEALKSIGVDGSYTNRKKIAAKNGIKNYTGTAAQNVKMLNLLKQGELIKA